MMIAMSIQITNHNAHTCAHIINNEQPDLPVHTSLMAHVPPALAHVGVEVTIPEYPELQAAIVQLPAKVLVAVPVQLYPVVDLQAAA